MDLLQRFTRRDRATERHNRISFGVGGREPRREVGDTWARRRDRDAGSASHATDAAGNERRILFMAADHRFDLRVDQSVEYGVNFCPGDTEDMGDPLGFKRAHHKFRAGLGQLARTM